MFSYFLQVDSDGAFASAARIHMRGVGFVHPDDLRKTMESKNDDREQKHVASYKKPD